MEQFLAIPWLKAYAGLSINISAAYFAVAFIGSNIVFPYDLNKFLVLIWNIIFGIVFLLITVKCEKEIEK